MVCIIDDEGYGWSCRLMHNIGEEGNSGLGAGWADFAKHMGFEPGSEVKFGVYQQNGNVLFYIP